MIKKLLPAGLCLLCMASAYSFGPRPLRPSGRFSVAPEKARIEKTSRFSLNTRAEAPDSLNFTYADQVYSALGLGEYGPVGDTIYLAFEITPEIAAQFAGDEVTRVNITTGVYQDNLGNYKNLVNNIRIFTSEEAGGTPNYIQDAVLGDEAYTQYSVPLDKPIKIEEGKSLVLGYAFAIPNIRMYYVPVDGIPTENTAVSIMGIRAKDSEEPIEWSSFSTSYGALCMGCTIKGDKFPENQAAFAGLYGVAYAEPGEQFDYHFFIQGKSLITESVDITVKVGDQEEVSNTITLDEPIGYNEYAEVIVPAVSDTENLALPVKYTLAKVNGVDNIALPNEVTVQIECFPRDKGYDRVNLIEEGTGTWCGWCPRGIVMMEYVAENYPELFAGVALHSQDRMSVASVNSAINKLFSGFPSAVINRNINLEEMSTDEIEQFVAIYGSTPGKMGFEKLEASVDMEGNVNVDATVGTGFDINNAHDTYRLAFYLVQNGMGPYSQTNYYAGGQNGPMGGWESKGQSVQTVYNDVARYLAGGYYGFSKSIPTSMKAGETCEYSASFPVTDVSAGEFELVAMIIDTTAGVIANAKKISVENAYYLGVDEIGTTNGVVARKFFDMNGVEVKTPQNGIFIVRSVLSDGSVKNSKVIVK